jgi:hypothetical protein
MSVPGDYGMVPFSKPAPPWSDTAGPGQTRGAINQVTKQFTAHDADATLHLTNGNAPSATTAGQLTASAGTVNTEGNTTSWGVAQQNGLSAGFNIFTPASDYGSYLLVVAGKDAATGLGASNGFLDQVVFNSDAGTLPIITAVSSTSTIGTPGARTYTVSSGALHLAVASGMTWYVDLFITKLDA